MQTALVVSIHDASPLTQKRVAQMLDDLKALGVAQTSLLVIPNHHHKAPLEENPAFGGWLQETSQAGHETVAHGFFHQRPPSGGWRTRLLAEYYTAGEGEFLDLSETDAAGRLEKAGKIFAGLGLQPRGFIAPAWLLGPEAEKAVRKADFDYTTRLGEFLDLKTGAVTRSQSLVWSVRAAWRRMLSLGWNAWLFERLAKTPLLRVGLHPPDWDHPAIRKQCLKLIARALTTRKALTYEEWMDRQRGN